MKLEAAQLWHWSSLKALPLSKACCLTKLISKLFNLPSNCMFRSCIQNNFPLKKKQKGGLIFGWPTCRRVLDTLRTGVYFPTALCFHHTLRSTVRSVRTANAPFLYCSAYWLNGVAGLDKRQWVLPENVEMQPCFLFIKCQVDWSDWRQVDADQCHFDCCFAER